MRCVCNSHCRRTRHTCGAAVLLRFLCPRLRAVMLNSARRDGIRHDAAAVRCNTVSASHLRRGVKDRAFPQNGTFGMRDIPENPHKRRGFAAGKRTSDTSLIIIHQKKDVCQYRRRRIFPFAEYGDVFRPRKRGRGGGGGTPVSGVRTETNVNAQRRTCRTEVWKKCMHQTHPAARKSAFRIINTAHSA